MIKLNVILPKAMLFNIEALSRIVENTLDGAAKAATVDFEVTTQTWEHKPDFVTNATPGKRQVYTTDKIYKYVNDGTKPHIITAKNAKQLVFGVPYGAKTTVQVIGSGQGSKGRTIVRKKSVQHPGNEAREFTVVIAEKWAEQLPVTMQRAIDSEV
jgi:hypothetical protein